MTSVTAQSTIQVNPGVLIAGGVAEIHVSDPKNAGESVIVEIDNGSSSHPRTDYVEIHLGEDGKGSLEWDVPDDPNWDAANFTPENGSSVSRMIMPGEEPAPVGEVPPHVGEHQVRSPNTRVHALY